jgi:hypothetical protein
MEAADAKRSAAIAIAVSARVLRRCEFHEDIVLVNPAGDIQNGYRMGNAKFSANELGTTFDSRRDMTDAIKAAVDEHALTDCPRCDKLRD